MTEPAPERLYPHAQCSYCGKRLNPAMNSHGDYNGWWSRRVGGGTLWRCREHPFEAAMADQPMR